MTRWFMIVMAVIGLIMALLTRSPGILGLALLMMVVGVFGAVVSLAAARISANSRPDVSMLPPEALLAIRDKANAKSPPQAAMAQPASAPPGSLGNTPGS